jgi:hypothetical protein
VARKAFLLRIRPELWEEVEHWAADELRSVNSQIEYLLRQAVTQRRRKTGAPEPEEGEGAQSATGESEAGPDGPADGPAEE